MHRAGGVSGPRSVRISCLHGDCAPGRCPKNRGVPQQLPKSHISQARAEASCPARVGTQAARVWFPGKQALDLSFQKQITFVIFFSVCFCFSLMKIGHAHGKKKGHHQQNVQISKGKHRRKTRKQDSWQRPDRLLRKGSSWTRGGRWSSPGQNGPTLPAPSHRGAAPGGEPLVPAADGVGAPASSTSGCRWGQACGERGAPPSPPGLSSTTSPPAGLAGAGSPEVGPWPGGCDGRSEGAEMQRSRKGAETLMGWGRGERRWVLRLTAAPTGNPQGSCWTLFDLVTSSLLTSSKGHPCRGPQLCPGLLGTPRTRPLPSVLPWCSPAPRWDMPQLPISYFVAVPSAVPWAWILSPYSSSAQRLCVHPSGRGWQTLHHHHTHTVCWEPLATRVSGGNKKP